MVSMEQKGFRFEYCTFVPAMTVLPSLLHAMLMTSGPRSTFPVHALVLTSQIRTVPSFEQLANSASFVGLKATFSIAAECPRSSVECLKEGRSGFHTRIEALASPVAM